MTTEGAVLLVLSAIFGYLHLLYQGGCAGGVETEGCFKFNPHTISLSATISLLSLTAFMPLPPSKFIKISIFYVIFACASILSSSVPAKLMWMPYISCIRLFFHLLPNSFQVQFLRFSQTLWNNADQHMRAVIEKLVNPGASTPPISSSSLEPGGVSEEEAAPGVVAVEEAIPGVSVEEMNCMISEFSRLNSA